MNRRGFVQGILAAGVASALPLRMAGAQAGTPKAIADMQKNWRMLLAEGIKVPSPGEKLALPAAEWRKRLDKAQFQVMREEGTERAGTSHLNAEKRPGIYACAGCDLPLFTSDMKYESGTGWPSFFTTIPGVFGTKQDNHLLFMTRTEYHCIRCGGHHGHVFDDGPPPTRQRWCNNGVALNFIPRTGKA